MLLKLFLLENLLNLAFDIPKIVVVVGFIFLDYDLLTT